MKSKFKIGDKVEIKKGIKEGQTGTIIKIKLFKYTDKSKKVPIHKLDMPKNHWFNSTSLKLIERNCDMCNEYFDGEELIEQYGYFLCDFCSEFAGSMAELPRKKVKEIFGMENIDK